MSTSVAGAVEGPRTLAPLGRRLCRVTGREAVGPYVLVAAADPDGPDPAPGPVLHAERRGGWGGESGRPHLGRAFSVCRTRDGRLEFLLEAIGPGTERLAELGEGDGLWLVGPLGIGFTQPPAGSRALLVGGGIGIAPLVIWAEMRCPAPHAVPAGLSKRRSTPRRAVLFPGERAVATDDGTGRGRPSRTGHRPPGAGARANGRASMRAGHTRCSRR